MAASQYHFNSIKREYSKLLETFSIRILFFKNLFHLKSKSKENFLRIEVYGVFLLTLFCVFFKNKGNSLGLCS